MEEVERAVLGQTNSIVGEDVEELERAVLGQTNSIVG